MRQLKALALCRSFLTAQTVSGKRNQVADNMNEYGITQSTGLTVYYSLDQVRFVAYYKREGGQVPLSPEIISAEIKTQIELHKGSIFPIRKFVLIIEGDADFLRIFRLLHEENYQGNLILQTARSKEGKDAEVLVKYKNLVEGWWKEAKID